MTPMRLQPGEDPTPGTVVDRLPVFPLPNAVFFPNTLLPLHVFEPRYRALVQRVMETDQRMGVALLRPGFEGSYHENPPIHDVICMGEVVTLQDLPDGRSNVLLRGLSRVRVLGELDTAEVFRVMRVRVEADEMGGQQGDALERQVATVRQLFSTVIARVPQLQIQDAGVLFTPDADPAFVLDSIASAVPADPRHKQELLEERDLVKRAELLAEVLAEAVADTLTASRGNV